MKASNSCKLLCVMSLILAAVPLVRAADGASNPDERARALLKSMTQDEKLVLVFGYFSSDAPWKNSKQPKDGLPQSAGYVPGIARLGIPAQYQTDAGIGVASQPGDHPRLRTALPSGISTAATWDPELAYAGGRMIGNEARSSGFNVMLAGGINLMRDPRNGRNFEYGGEDPWLAANMVAAQIRGIQSNHVLSTIKHYALNDQETSRNSLSVHIDDASARMSDLLAFQLAIEQSHPGAVMCAYNRINGDYSCESDWLLNKVLKSDWAYPGFVMSDWGGTHSTIPAANAGLDQDSGAPFDASPYFGEALKEAVENGYVPQARLDDMVMRILRSMFDKGLFDYPVKAADIDFAAHALVSQADAEGGMVLLKNSRHLLPLNAAKSIALIGSHADVAVLSGGGSSQVYPVGGILVEDSTNGEHEHVIYFRSSPMTALAARGGARIVYEEGDDIRAAIQAAANNDIAIVFAHEWSSEGHDGTLRLDGNQDALIAAVAKANSNTVVVLQTGGPVLMPWIDKVAGVLEAWYPGSNGGVAIARVLTGEADPSGRLPVTFPRSVQQLPRPVLDGYPEKPHARFDVDYTNEGAAVGYKWFDLKGLSPLFAFGYGLSYGQFAASDLTATVANGQRITAHFAVRNIGPRAGQYVAQLYVSPVRATGAHWEAPKRLAGFKKVSLQAGASTDVSLEVDPRLLAVFDEAAHRWSIAAGEYDVVLATDSRTAVAHARVQMSQGTLAAGGSTKDVL
jgi:beta-glucosidase